MDETIIRSLQGLLDEGEERRLLIWRRASLENERRYRAASEVWALTGAGAERQAHGPPRLAEPIRARRLSAWRETGTMQAAGGGWARGAAAAAVMALTVWGVVSIATPRPPAPPLAAAELVTGPTDMLTAKLTDGTVVRLAPRSRLRAGATSGSRDVWLDGRAFFAVAKDPDRPFFVRTRLGDARVLGTRFEVKLDEGSMRVVVAEGEVALAAGEQVVSIREGEMSETQDREPTLGVVPVDVDRVLDWLDRFLVFQATPLRVVAAEVERAYGVRVELPDSALAERTVTAWFSDQSLEEVVGVVCRIADAHCTLQGPVVSITP